eukprot:5634382-Pleurochrysis_carterae.AAC.1
MQRTSCATCMLQYSASVGNASLSCACAWSAPEQSPAKCACVRAASPSCTSPQGCSLHPTWQEPKTSHASAQGSSGSCCGQSQRLLVMSVLAQLF